MSSLETKYLIDESLVSVTREALKSDPYLDVYLHTIGGTATVSGGVFGSQDIESVAWSDSEIAFIKSVYNEIDQRLDLDFKFTEDQESADVAIFFDTEINTGSSNSSTLGLAISNNTEDGRYFWEIFLNYPQFIGKEDYFRYAQIHEIGHTLGLEHPFENYDGDAVDGVTDPWQSSFPEDTVMAYRNPETGQWPQTFRDNDWAALIELWGPEAQVVIPIELTLSIDDGGDARLNAAEIHTVSFSGTTSGLEDGQTVSLQISDQVGSTLSHEVAVSDGNYRLQAVDLSTLVEGVLTISASASDVAGNPTAQVSSTVTKDVTPPLLTLSIDDGGDARLNAAEIHTVSFSGTTSGLEDGQTVSLQISDRTAKNLVELTTVESNQYSIEGIDLSALDDGILLVSANASDTAGNPNSPIATSIIKDSTTADPIPEALLVIRATDQSNLSTIISSFIGKKSGLATISYDIQDLGYRPTIESSTWSDSYLINRVAQAGNEGDLIQARQVDMDHSKLPAAQPFFKTGSLLKGSDASDIVRGLAGWDILEAGGGDDIIHGGNGRDILSGGSGSDELHGDFGWNTYTDQRDGFVDLIAIKSDQFLYNWWYGQAGNSPNGEKSDIIEKLDGNDQIKILGVATERLSFSAASAHGQDGIGIFADGILEALYTGGDLSAAQLRSMTTGDASDAVINNQLWSYNFGPTPPPLV